ncbi:K02A2.6-like [Cordylochernes scorpioides]|uniref:K02A2.6-like n=1 Tax=Cordylochernes scorpioides TaxID=51811 RepID=A0ABY6L3J5_9ARAC|nr:K02A2.6-like [Cordylochernes scorpioides]
MDDYGEYIENYLDKIARTRQVVINNTEKTQERMKRNYDKKHNERIYEPGHLVAVWTTVRKIGKCEKLLRKYFGPYQILNKLSDVNYLIEPKDNPGQDPFIVHVSRFKPYFERIDEVIHEDVTTSGEGEVLHHGWLRHVLERCETCLRRSRPGQFANAPSQPSCRSQEPGAQGATGNGSRPRLEEPGGVLVVGSGGSALGSPRRGEDSDDAAGEDVSEERIKTEESAKPQPGMLMLGEIEERPAMSWLERVKKTTTKLRGVLQASCCLKRSDCCLPPTPVYFLEDSRRFNELLSPVLLLLSLTVLQLAIQAQNRENREAIEAQNQETREALQAQHQELKESLGHKFKYFEDEIPCVKEEMKEEMVSLKQRLAAVEMGHPRTPGFQQENNNSGRPFVKVPTFDGQSS